MKHNLSLLLLPLLALAICGCGTFSDRICGPAGGSPYYRGVRMDMMAVHDGGPLMLMAADIPFSAVADTLLVPFIAYDQWKEPSPVSNEVSEDQDSVQESLQSAAATANEP